jgi:hypothetical protein
MYGGFQLQLGDHDLREREPAVYGGMIRRTIFKDPITAPVAPGASSGNLLNRLNLVAALRDDLWTLGFWIFPRQRQTSEQASTGVVRPETRDAFDWQTAWAVREFQVAASMPKVAVQDVNKTPTDEEAKNKGRYLSRLSAKANDKVFGKHPSGVVTPETAELIKYWIEKHYRCPVVIQAMKMVPGPKPHGSKKKVPDVIDSVRVENIWRHDEVTVGKTKMFAWDFSGHYDFPSDHSNEQVAVGRYIAKGKFGGPIADRSDSWAVARVTPQSWRGKDWASMTKEEKSTWRAIMAVADQECAGGLDVVNFWDNCHGSAGHYHWTMPKSDGSGGEFCGFMAMLEGKFPDAFKKCFGQFGLWGPRWVGSAASDDREQLHAGVTYGGFVYTKDVGGKFVRHPAPGKFSDANWLRSWHAAYRLEMAARTCADYRKAMWDYAGLRIKGLRGMSQVDAWLPAGCKTPGTKVTLGDIFTSERSIAYVLRLHVWRPASFISNKRELVKKKNKKTKKIEETWVGLPILHDALKKLVAEGTLKDHDVAVTDNDNKPLKWEVLVKDWTDHHERILLDAMLDFVGEYTKPSAKGSIQRARYWPLKTEATSPYDLALEPLASKDKSKDEPPPRLHVRQNSPGLPPSPKREVGQKEAILGDLEEFQPRPGRKSFQFAE